MMDIVKWSNLLVWVSLAFHLALFIYALMNIKKRTISTFAIMYYLITISMFANLYRPPAGIIAERFLFSPVLGFCILLVIIILKLYKVQFKENHEKFNLLKSKAIIPFIIILTLYSFKTISRTADWKDTMTLVKHDMPYLEQSAKANFIYAGLLRQDAYEKINKTGNFQQYLPQIYLNVDHLNQAIKIYPGYYDAYDKLAESYYFYLKNTDKAIQCLKKAIQINPEFGLAYYNLGYIFRNQKQYDSAIWDLNQAIILQPGYKPFYQYLAGIYYEIGDTIKGINIIQLGKIAKRKNRIMNRKERIKLYNHHSP